MQDAASEVAAARIALVGLVGLLAKMLGKVVVGLFLRLAFWAIDFVFFAIRHLDLVAGHYCNGVIVTPGGSLNPPLLLSLAIARNSGGISASLGNVPSSFIEAIPRKRPIWRGL